jgi:hypothetical protein
MTSKFTQSTLITFLAIHKLLCFVEKLLIARYFGTADQAVVFVVVQGLYITGWLSFEEILSPELIPTQVRHWSAIFTPRLAFPEPGGGLGPKTLVVKTYCVDIYI